MVIYKVTNKINGKIYIGQTIKKLKSRWLAHINKSNSSKTSVFHAAIRKYKKENFTIEETKRYSSKEELNLEEKRFIEEYNSLVPNGYNILKGGSYHVSRGEKRSFSIEHRQKIREKFMPRMEEMRQISSKDWVVVSPKQEILNIRNIQDFCRNNNLEPSCMIRVAQGKIKQHKKWLCYYKEEFQFRYKPLEKKIFKVKDSTAVIHEFENPCLYADKLGVDRSWFNKVCNGKAKSYKGFTLYDQ
jgi:group I intron endonuclease